MNRIGRITAAIVLMMLGTLPVRPQTVEMTDEFKQVVRELAKDQFRTFVFDALKKKDPVIAASTVALIERVVSGDSTVLIADQVALSLIDYSLFIELESTLRAAIPNAAVTTLDGAPADAAEYSRLIKVGVLLMYERIARDHYLIVNSAVRQMLSEETETVASYRVTNGSGSSLYGLAVYVTMLQHRDAIESLIRRKEALKNVCSTVILNDTAALTAVGTMYQMAVKKEFPSSAALLQDAFGLLTSTLDTVYYAYDALKDVPYAHLFRDLAPYVHSLMKQKLEHLPLTVDRQTVRTVVSTLSAINNEEKNGFSYAVGLWAGVFVNGGGWTPPRPGEPVLSLRLNDRLQYTFVHGENQRGFLYIGGFIDAALKELSNKTANEFIIGGIGYGAGPVAWTVSGAYPIGGAGSKGGFVLTMMYDLPLAKIIGVL